MLNLSLAGRSWLSRRRPQILFLGLCCHPVDVYLYCLLPKPRPREGSLPSFHPHFPPQTLAASPSSKKSLQATLPSAVL